MLPDRGEYEHLVHHLDIEELVHHLDIEELLYHLDVGHHLDVGVAGEALSLRMSPCLANIKTAQKRALVSACTIALAQQLKQTSPCHVPNYLL